MTRPSQGLGLRSSPAFHAFTISKTLLLSLFLLSGCLPKKDLGLVSQHGDVRCVFLENATLMPATFQVSINGIPETVTLSSKEGIYLYEPLPEHIRFSELEPTRSSISSSDGSRMSFAGLSSSLQAVHASTGQVVAQGWSGGAGSYKIPSPEWLAEVHKSARLVPRLRKVSAIIVSTAQPESVTLKGKPPLPSPDGLLTLHTSVEDSHSDPKTFGCVIVEVQDKAAKVLHRENSRASDFQRWDIAWISNTDFRLTSSDIGTYNWTRQPDATWKKH